METASNVVLYSLISKDRRIWSFWALKLPEIKTEIAIALIAAAIQMTIMVLLILLKRVNIDQLGSTFITILDFLCSGS